MATEIILAHPFLRPTGPTGPDEQRRKNLSRTLSWILVAALHVALFFAFVISFRPFDRQGRPMAETILTLPHAGDNAPPVHIVNPVVPSKAPPMTLSAPIIIIKPPPPPPDQTSQPVTPGDILGAVGRELACSAGSWEHLTQAERNHCGGQPWHAMRMPNGTLVMVPRSQLPRLKEPDAAADLRVTGADQIQHENQTGPGCPLLQNTPCLHPSQGGAGINILGGGN